MVTTQRQWSKKIRVRLGKKKKDFESSGKERREREKKTIDDIGWRNLGDNMSSLKNRNSDFALSQSVSDICSHSVLLIIRKNWPCPIPKELYIHSTFKSLHRLLCCTETEAAAMYIHEVWLMSFAAVSHNYLVCALVCKEGEGEQPPLSFLI